jgi:hypothetical protein
VILVFIKVTVILVQIFKLTATPVSKTLTFKIGQHLGTHALVCLNKVALDVGFRHQEVIERWTHRDAGQQSRYALQIFKCTATPVSKTLTFKIGQHLGTHALVCLNKVALDVGFRHQEVIEGWTHRDAGQQSLVTSRKDDCRHVYQTSAQVCCQNVLQFQIWEAVSYESLLVLKWMHGVRDEMLSATHSPWVSQFTQWTMPINSWQFAWMRFRTLESESKEKWLH